VDANDEVMMTMRARGSPAADRACAVAELSKNAVTMMV
jgi:hypothetical protein